MTDIFEPVAKKVQGNDKIVFMTTVADDAAPKVATEIGATTSIEATLAAYGRWNAPVNVNTGTAPTRIGTVEQLPEEGNAQRQVIPFSFPVDPSKAKSDANNKMWAFLTQGTEFKAFVRRGIDHETDFAAADVGLTYSLRVGFVPEPTQTGDDEFAEYQVTVNLIPLGNPVEATLAA